MSMWLRGQSVLTSTEPVCSTPTSPSPWAGAESCQDIRDKMDLDQAGMIQGHQQGVCWEGDSRDYWDMEEKQGTLTTQSGAPWHIVPYGLTIGTRKVWDERGAAQEQPANDLKKQGIQAHLEVISVPQP
ncbi:hypothetical protein GOODEAATRI_016087 [Goodea atripinnis]|uniref:MHC class I antigen n=1 Tax=Goodea atripinnis TaxID=208336 RepID=A0ABV0N1V3_9TELE